MPIATPIFDPDRGWVPRGTMNASGYSGRKPFMVDTSEEDGAYLAMGLPVIGSQHPVYAGSYARTYEYEYVGGTDADGKGWCIVWINYEPITAITPGEIAQPGDAFTELLNSTGTATVRFDVNLDPIPECPRETNSMELVVRAYRTNLSFINAFAAIQNMGNLNPVIVPPVFGLSGTETIGARRLLARTFSVQPVKPGVLEVRYTFGFGEQDWYYKRYVPEDAEGNSTGPEVKKDVQGEVNYPAPGVLW